MNIILINPAFNRYGGLKGHGGTMLPLGLCYLAAYTRQQNPDIKFKILDAEIKNLSHEETVIETVNFFPDLIGITSNTCVFDSVIKLTSLLKSSLPNVPIIIGGPHPSALPEQTLRDTGADFVARGEGELTFEELVSQIKSSQQNWNKIKGLAYWGEQNNIKINPARELIENLDILPFPARDLVDNHLYVPASTKRVSLGSNTPLATSRGCPFNCGFCAARTVWTRRVRQRKPEHVMTEIEECINKYKIDSFNLTDEFFTANKKRVLKMCRLISERKINIDWMCSARAQGLDKKTLEAMKKAGCQEICFGIESGNPEILKKMDKSLDLNEAQKVIRLTKKVGIMTHACYLLGYIGETEKTMRDTIQIAKKLNTQVAAFFIASPLPGTPLYGEAKAKGYLRQGIKWINYSPLSNLDSVLNLPNLSTSVIREWHRKALREYYIRLSYIIPRILSIRHWYEVVNIFAGLKLFFNIKK